MISSCGHSRETDSEYRWDGLERGRKSFAVFQPTLSGEGRLEYESRSLTLAAGDAFLVPVPHNHRYYLPDTSDHWEFVYVVVYGAEIMRLAKSLVKRSGPLIRLAGAFSGLCNHARDPHRDGGDHALLRLGRCL